MSGKLMLATNDREKRQSIIDACLRMNALGINQGTSGNISLRHDAGMLIPRRPACPMRRCSPNRSSIWGSTAVSIQPSARRARWRFHLDILKARPDVNAVVLTHPALFDDARHHGPGEIHRCTT